MTDILFAYIVLLTFADLASTLWGEDHHMTESNGLLARLFARFGWDAVLFPFKWAFIGYLGHLNYTGQIRWEWLAIIAFGYSVVVANNLIQIRKQKAIRP